MKNQNIPQIDSIQKLAEFWDTHDLTDFEEQLEEVKDPIFEGETIVKIRLEPNTVKLVKEVANAKGIDYTELIREWVLEKVSDT